MGAPKTLPADFFSQQEAPTAPAAAPDTLPADFNFESPTAPSEPQQSLFGELLDMGKLMPALIYSRVLGTDPHFAYEHSDDIEKKFREVSGDFDARVGKATTVQDDPLSLALRKQVPEPFESHGLLENFIHSASEFVNDPVMYGPAIIGLVSGGPAGAVKGANVGFALDAGLRKMLADSIQKGDVKSSGDLFNRAAATVWAAAKGYAAGKTMEAAGMLPAGSVPYLSNALKAAYQAAGIEVVGSLLEGQTPTLEGFERNAVTVGGFNLIIHGATLAIPNAKQGLLDVYTKDGTTPEQTVEKLQAQPPAKPEIKAGLQPAIRLTAQDGTKSVISGEDANHSDLAERVTGDKPVSLDELNADPKLANKALTQPELHDQDVIDRAMELANEPQPELLPQGQVSKRPPWEMSFDELDQAEKGDRENDHRTLVNVFGDEDQAKRYERLQRAANSSYDTAKADKASAELSQMESGLSEDQQAQLYGTGQYATKYTYEDYQEFRNAVGSVEGDNPQDLGSSMRYAITKVGDADLTKPESLTHEQQIGFAQLRRGFEIADEQGWDKNEVLQAALKGAASRFEPSDAAFMLRRFTKTSAPKQPALPEPDAQASLGGPNDIAYLRNNPPKSGRGFQKPDGTYINRNQAKSWVKDNEPDVYEMWKVVSGDEKAEFHTQDYMEARQRVANLITLEGDSKYNISDEVTQFQAKNRSTINAIKAGDTAKGYGNEAIRATFDAPRKLVRSFGRQIEGQARKLIPESRYIEQEAVSFMRDYRDDPEALRKQIEEVRAGDNEELKRAIPSMEQALNPTPDMLEADKLLTKAFTQANELRMRFVGADSSIDPARYSPRNFMFADEEASQGGVGGGKFAKRSSHDIRREYLHRLDPLMDGDVKARTFNAFDELGVYFDKLATNVGRSVFESEIINSELGKKGNISGAPANWKNLTGIPNTIIKEDPNTGEIQHIKQAFVVHPKVADAMRPLLAGDELGSNPYFYGAKAVQGVVKGAELSLSVFHMRALTISFMNNAGLDAYRNAMLSDNSSPEFEAQERHWATFGLETTKTSRPYEAYRGLQPSSLEPRSALLEKFQKGYEPMDKAFKGLTKATFEVVQRKFKVIDASTKGAAWAANHPLATDAEFMSAMRGIAKEVNAVYGGLNWDVMGVNPTIQTMGRLFFLAPDWTFSNVANLKYAGPRTKLLPGVVRGEAGPGGNAARAFWAKSFVTGFTLSLAASLFFTGKPQDSDHWYEVSLGNDANGHPMYDNVFYAGAPKDAITTYNLVMKHGFPRGLILAGVNKAGPLVGTPARLAMNMDWSGKPIEERKQGLFDKSVSEVGFSVGNIAPVPFTIGSLARRMLDPKQDITYKDFLFSIAAGAPVIHEGEGKEPKTVHLQGSGRTSTKGKVIHLR